MVIPRAPRYLDGSLLGYATVESMEPRTHYFGNWSPREWRSRMQWIRIPVDGRGAKRGHDDRLFFRALALYLCLSLVCICVVPKSRVPLWHP